MSVKVRAGLGRVGGKSVSIGVLGSLALLTAVSPAWAQRPVEGSPAASYVVVDAEAVALTGVTVVDGTAGPALRNQTVVIQGNRIAAVGPDGSVTIPEGAEVHELAGHTVTPGMMGLHDHLYYTAAGGRAAQLTYSAPRLYLGSGVTSVRTTGSQQPYAELNLKSAIEEGTLPGPRIHITAPYITGGSGASTMTFLNNPEQARRFVRYWAAEGATWLKAYTNIRSEELGAAIDEAHKLGIKVTGHLCSISFTEAVDLGIDNIEHGLPTNSDYTAGRAKDECPQDLMTSAGDVDINSPEVAQTFQKMIDAEVPMTSTLAVYELFFQGRPVRDQRSLDAMAPDVREDYLRSKAQIDEVGLPVELLHKAMAYEKAFYDAGGILAAGVDPTGNGGALPGYGDQRNYELLIEAGFQPEEAVQVLSANGARVLDVFDDLGTIESGKIADLVVLQGDLTADPSVIRNVTIVFKDGVGYDSPKMLDDVRGRVGIN
ncbi:MAG: amidohydrolase family protein [Gemmatimonadetes bacterium]|nr:amidohydrolase family protein [Gemmatimonadota bacterium]